MDSHTHQQRLDPPDLHTRNLANIISKKSKVETTPDQNEQDSRIEYYVIGEKIIIRFFGCLSPHLINDARAISKKLDHCNEIILDLTKAYCNTMSGMGILTYLLIGSQKNPEKSFALVTGNVMIKEFFTRSWKNIKIVTPSR